jgi:hypothetical protein
MEAGLGETAVNGRPVTRCGSLVMNAFGRSQGNEMLRYRHSAPHNVCIWPNHPANSGPPVSQIHYHPFRNDEFVTLDLDL